MKKILYTALAASLFAFSSCDDILDTSKKSSMEKTEVFSNEALVNDVVMGLHQSFGNKLLSWTLYCLLRSQQRL